MFNFGSGNLYGTPTQDAYGNAVATPTPIKFGTLQDVSIDISFDTKTLFGQNQFAVMAARGKGKIGGKAKFANLNGQTLNSLFFGQGLVANGVGVQTDTAGIAIPATPFTITAGVSLSATTIQVPNAGTWSADLSVINTATGIPLIRVASAPTTGQYTVAAGVYVFATADVGNVVFINYEYTYTSTVTHQLQINNLLMGAAPTFAIELSLPFNGKQMTIKFPNAIASKLSMATKQDDFIIPEFDFEIFANAAGQIVTWSLSD